MRISAEFESLGRVFAQDGVDLAEPVGSEPGYRRPAIVLQRDEVNASGIDTVVLCVLTSNTRLARARGNTLLRRGVTGLPRDSVANSSQIATVNKADLDRVVGVLPEAQMSEVDEDLRGRLRIDAPSLWLLDTE